MILKRGSWHTYSLLTAVTRQHTNQLKPTYWKHSSPEGMNIPKLEATPSHSSISMMRGNRHLHRQRAKGRRLLKKERRRQMKRKRQMTKTKIKIRIKIKIIGKIRNASSVTKRVILQPNARRGRNRAIRMMRRRSHLSRINWNSWKRSLRNNSRS